MSRKPALSSHNEVINSQILSYKIYKYIISGVPRRHVLFGLEGSYGEPLLRQFALSSQTLRFVRFTQCGGFSLLTIYLVYYKVEAVNFLDDLHGECYVELKSKEDLARALDKHALRVGTRLRRRLIEVYLAIAIFIELQVQENCLGVPRHFCRDELGLGERGGKRGSFK